MIGGNGVPERTRNPGRGLDTEYALGLTPGQALKSA